MRKLLSSLAKLLALLLFALLVWGIAIEPRLYELTRQTATVSNLPAAWENRSLVLLADLQVGMWLDNTDTIRRIATRAAELRPSAVLIAGDFVYNPIEIDEGDEADELESVDENIREVNELLNPLSGSGIPVLAVFGNHDYGMMKSGSRKNEEIAQRLEKALSAVGIRVLHNQSVEVEGLYIAGIGSKFAGDARPLDAISQIPADAPRVVFMHHPDLFTELPAGTAPLALAAHTHGGQIRIPGFSSWSWLTWIERGKVPGDGWIAGYGSAGNRLYVTRGIGFSRVPVRIFCRPELVEFTLTRW